MPLRKEEMIRNCKSMKLCHSIVSQMNVSQLYIDYTSGRVFGR